MQGHAWRTNPISDPDHGAVGKRRVPYRTSNDVQDRSEGNITCEWTCTSLELMQRPTEQTSSQKSIEFAITQRYGLSPRLMRAGTPVDPRGIGHLTRCFTRRIHRWRKFMWRKFSRWSLRKPGFREQCRRDKPPATVRSVGRPKRPTDLTRDITLACRRSRTRTPKSPGIRASFAVCARINRRRALHVFSRSLDRVLDGPITRSTDAVIPVMWNIAAGSMMDHIAAHDVAAHDVAAHDVAAYDVAAHRVWFGRPLDLFVLKAQRQFTCSSHIFLLS